MQRQRDSFSPVLFTVQQAFTKPEDEHSQSLLTTTEAASGQKPALRNTIFKFFVNWSFF